MKPADPDPADDYYVDTPRGLFTASGTWYHTRESDLQTFAGELIVRVPLVDLLKRADVWLRSARTVTLWAWPLLLAALPLWGAVLAGLVLYPAWRVLAPAMGNVAPARLLQVMENVGLQFVLYAVVLSLLGAGGATGAVVAGLIGFVLLRWNVLDRVLGPLLKPVLSNWYPIPEADQMLRAVVIKAALHEKLPRPELDRMEQQILSTLYGPGKKK